MLKDSSGNLKFTNSTTINSSERKVNKFNIAVTNGGTFEDNTTFAANKMPTPVKAGYTFGGWYTDAACTTGALTKNANGIYTATGSETGTVYYAKWNLANNFVEITYNSNMAGESSKVIATAKDGTAYTSANLFTRAGYSFKGWNTGADGKGTAYDVGAPLPTSANLTLYAQWTLDKPTISGTATAVYGNEVTLTASTEAVGASYQWYKDGAAITDETNSSLTLTDVADNGAYTVKITVGSDTATSEPTTVTITKAAPTVKITADQTSLTGSGTVKLTVTPNGVPEKGTVTVACDNGITVTKNTDGTFSAALPNETKTYTFTASYAGDDNHEKATDTCQVSVTRRSSSGGSSSSGRSYAVSAPSAKNGDVTVSPKNASKGDRVTVTVKPDSGYEIGSVTVLDSKGNELKLTDKGNGKYTFTMPGGKVEVKATFVKAGETSPFVDVPADSYYFDAVKWAQKLGITNGKTDALFGSSDPCTRGQIVTFLWRAAGSPAPKGTAKVPADVLPGSYCYDAVAWAIENGVTNGFADGTFGVNSTCTRGQSVTFLYRALGTAPTTVNGFTDVAAGDFYAEAVAWAVENGVTNGTTDSTFSPSNGCTRAQIVTFLFRTYNQ